VLRPPPTAPATSLSEVEFGWIKKTEVIFVLLGLCILPLTPLWYLCHALVVEEELASIFAIPLSTTSAQATDIVDCWRRPNG